jgi:phage tail protein X
MQVAIFQGENSLSDLVARLFNLEGQGARAGGKAAEESLLRANPHLADLSQVAPGAVIVIPPDAPPTKGDVAPANLLVLSQLATATIEKLAAVRAALTAESERVATEAQASLGLATSREVQAIAADNDVLRDRLPHIIAAARDTLAHVEADRIARQQPLDRIQTILQQYAGGQPT